LSWALNFGAEASRILRIARLGEDHMNKDEISGKVDQVVGKVKQGVGEAIGNQKVANHGVIDQAKGAAKETWGKAKDAANQLGESQRETAEERLGHCTFGI
jgi:uncharacterized protein YjbJ (UPF0337 family)